MTPGAIESFETAGSINAETEDVVGAVRGERILAVGECAHNLDAKQRSAHIRHAHCDRLGGRRSLFPERHFAMSVFRFEPEKLQFVRRNLSDVDDEDGTRE